MVRPKRLYLSDFFVVYEKMRYICKKLIINFLTDKFYEKIICLIVGAFCHHIGIC